MNRGIEVFWLINAMKEACPTECHAAISAGPRMKGLIMLRWEFRDEAGSPLRLCQYLEETQLDNIRPIMKECRRKMSELIQNRRKN